MNYLANMSLILADSNVERPDWIVKSFPIIEIVIACVITLCSILMIIAVVAQKGESNGVTGITGQADTFYNRNKGSSLQGKIKKLITIDAVIILVLSIAFLILFRIYGING